MKIIFCKGNARVARHTHGSKFSVRTGLQLYQLNCLNIFQSLLQEQLFLRAALNGCSLATGSKHNSYSFPSNICLSKSTIEILKKSCKKSCQWRCSSVYRLLWTYIKPSSSASTVDFELVNVCWDITYFDVLTFPIASNQTTTSPQSEGWFISS